MKYKKLTLLTIILAALFSVSIVYRKDNKFEHAMEVNVSYREYYDTYSERGNCLNKIDNYTIRYYYDIPVYKTDGMCAWYYGNNTYFLQFNSDLEDSIENEIVKNQVSASVIRELVIFTGTKFIENKLSKDGT